MGPLPVVVPDVDTDDVLEVAAAEDQQPVEALAPDARAEADPAAADRGAPAPARRLQGRAAGQLWHLDMTSVWVAEHGWVYLNAIIDCCTREIVGWSLELRCRAAEATG